MKHIFATILVLGFIFYTVSPISFAGPESTTYELKEYGFGTGGTTGVDSTTYSLYGILGEVDQGSLDSTNYRTLAGLTYTIQTNVPSAPTFTNVSSQYDRLQFILNVDNPTDTLFAIGISTDDFATTNYIQDDGTIGATLGSEDWQTYTNWGGASGEYVTGLATNTTYKIKVKAQQGDFTESGWSVEASASTLVASLTFGVSADSITFSNLNSGNSYTDSSKSTTVTTSTNAYNGYVVYARATQALTSNSDTIAHYSSPNSAPTTWSGNGFGYTTDDASLTGGTADRFTGSKYAGFTASTPGDPVADHAGPVLTAISNEQFTISYRVTAPATTDAGTYQSTVVYVVVPSY